MGNEIKIIVRKKPKFYRKDWHKKIKLGKGVKKNRKWRFPIGRHNKIRLNRKGHSQRPKIGWGVAVESKNKIKGLEFVRVENLKELLAVKKGRGIIIGNVGKKKRLEIIGKAKEIKIKILNKYKETKDAVS